MDDENRRYKLTDSTVPDFVYAKHLDHEARMLTIMADDFDSAAFVDVIVRYRHVAALKMKPTPACTGVVRRCRDCEHEILCARGAPAAYGKPWWSNVTVCLTLI